MTCPPRRKPGGTLRRRKKKGVAKQRLCKKSVLPKKTVSLGPKPGGVFLNGPFVIKTLKTLIFEFSSFFSSRGSDFRNCQEQRWQPLGDGRWGRVIGREGAERSVGRCHGVWKGMLYFCSCEPYSTSNKTEY